MKKNDTTFLQKLKDNAFYVALGVGFLAILAVVAVYTVQQRGTQLAENEVDLNQGSDYRGISTAKAVTRRTSEHTSELAPKTEIAGTTAQATPQKMEQTEAATEEAKEVDTQAEGEQIPVTAELGELNFTSDKTLDWPVSGDVILPFSMETTVYFKTLDQYQCNPAMLIAAGNGTTVKSVFLGKVTKVTSDDVYGNLVTVYLGNDFSVVYGQLDTIYVKEGDFVKAGDSIGTIGNPTDSFKEEGSHLFFQMLEKETPVNPMQYLGEK